MNGQSIVGNYLPLTGGTLTGNLSCNQLTCTSEVDTGSLSCSNLTVNGSLTLPTSYTNAPAANCLGYMTYSSRTTNLSVPAATGTVIHSININPGVWLLTGSAIFSTSGNANWFQIGLSTTNWFDDYTYVVQYNTTTVSGSGQIIPIPMRYYVCTAASQIINLMLYVNGCSVMVGNYSTNTTIQSIQIA